MNSTYTYNSKSAIIPVVMLMVGVEAISKFGLFGLSLRFDETQSILQSSLAPFRIINLVAKDVHIPLYELVLHYWFLIFGCTIATGRAFSLIFFISAIPVIYILGKQILNSTAALFATTMFALSPFMNWYGNEMRMYTLLTLVVMLNNYFFIRIFQNKEGHKWLGYFLTGLTGIFIHYFFLLVPLSQVVFFVVYAPLFPNRSLRRFIGIGVILAISLGIWIEYVATVQHLFTEHRISSWAPILPPATAIDVFNVFSQFIFGFQSDRINTVLVSAWPLCILLGLLALRRGAKLCPEIIYLIISIIVPIGTALILSLTIRPMFLSRYLIYTLPSLCLFIAWILSTYPPLLSRTLISGFLIAMTWALFIEIASPYTPVKEDYRAAAQYLEANAKSDDIIIVSAPFTKYPVDYYYRGDCPIATLPIWNQFVGAGTLPPFNAAKLPHEVTQLRVSRQRAFLLLSYDQGYENKIAAYFQKNFQLESEQHFSFHLDLYVYNLRRAAVNTNVSGSIAPDLINTALD